MTTCSSLCVVEGKHFDLRQLYRYEDHRSKEKSDDDEEEELDSLPPAFEEPPEVPLVDPVEPRR